MTDKCQEFLNELEQQLVHLPSSEINKVMSYYMEAIQDRLEDGISEEETIESFGSIADIVNNIEEEVSIGSIVKDKMTKKANEKNINYVLLALVIILGFPIWLTILILVIALLITVYALLWMIPVIILSIYVSLLLAAIVSAGTAIFMIPTSVFTTIGLFGVSLIAAGLAMILFSPLVFLGKKWLAVNIWPFRKIKHKLIRK